MSSPEATETLERQVRGLDTLRFVAAAVVVVSHGAGFPFRKLGSETGPWDILGSLQELAFNGPAAVVVFFVISGFCIHYPFSRGTRFEAVPFLVRRIIRVAGPLLAIWLVAHSIGVAAEGQLRLVLWSLYCELIYYALYPLLRLAMKKVRLIHLVIAAYGVSIILICLGWQIQYHWQFPVAQIWLITFPAWLLGCVLAEAGATRAPAKDAVSIWVWRFVTWSCSAGILLVYYHTPFKLGHPILLTPFYLLAAWWIWKEIGLYHRIAPPRLLEWAGRWSFSLYLVHVIVLKVTQPLTPFVVVNWLILLALLVGSSLAFYAVFEWPSHQLARWASRRVAKDRAA